MKLNRSISRRDFLKYSAYGLSGLALNRFSPGQLPVLGPRGNQLLQTTGFPTGERLGRACSTVNLRTRPSPDAPLVGTVYEDTVVVWLREVIGGLTNVYTNQRWVETPEGFLYGPNIQPVKNEPNVPITELPQNGSEKGMWVEVTVPYVDIFLANPPARSPLLQELTQPRFYYSQVFYVDQIEQNNQGQILYRVGEKYGSYGDWFWADATAFRPLKAADLEPIHPDVADKRILINLDYQTLSCYEGNDEVYFCRISSGAKFDAYGNVVDNWATPLGENHVVNRKWVSVHMGGGNAAAPYELFGVSWSSVFATGGVAIHSTYWHNNFGDPMSHGCVNVDPASAQWIFRWTLPEVPQDTGFIEVAGYSGTKVVVQEA